MFNDLSIATTAMSSFNNYALQSPLFFLLGILALPLFFMVYTYGRDFVSKLGWTNQNIEKQSGFVSSGILILWLLLFGGNYAVIRDGISLLPLGLSVVLFALFLMFTQQLFKLNYAQKLYGFKYKWLCFVALFLIAGLSAMPNWYSILLQVSAVFCGMVVGSRIKKDIPVIPFTSLIYGIILVLILMQPEFFRFGQFDSLTPIHILSVIITGFFAITALVARYANARSKIYESAFVKLRWLFRIMAFLAFVLFFMTESVPVFVGLMCVVALLEMLSIYHSKSINKHLSKVAWAWFMICFGIIIICPVISSIGILYLTFCDSVKVRDFTALL